MVMEGITMFEMKTRAELEITKIEIKIKKNAFEFFKPKTKNSLLNGHLPVKIETK